MDPKAKKCTDDKKARTVSWSPYVDEMAIKYTEDVRKFSSVSNMVETAMTLLIDRLEAKS